MPRKIMEEFRIHEISAVDHPAQEGAKMAIMKRRDPQAAGPQALSEFITNRYIAKTALPMELTTILSSRYGKIDELFDSAAALEAVLSKMNAEDGVKEVGAFLAKASEKWPDVTAVLNDAYGVSTNKGEDAMKDDAKSAAAVAKDCDEHEEEEEAAVSVEEEAFMEEELEDEEAKKSFRALSAEERKIAMAKAADVKKNDESLEIGGRTILKSKVGEDAFAVFKSQAESLAKANEEIAKQRDRAEMAELSKQAEESFSHLPGEIVAKAKVLKALGGLEKEDRETLTSMLTAGEKAIKAAYDTLGHKVGKDAGDPNVFLKHVNEIKARDKCSKNEAMQTARKEYPEEFKAYQAAN